MSLSVAPRNAARGRSSWWSSWRSGGFMMLPRGRVADQGGVLGKGLAKGGPGAGQLGAYGRGGTPRLASEVFHRNAVEVLGGQQVFIVFGQFDQRGPDQRGEFGGLQHGG